MTGVWNWLLGSLKAAECFSFFPFAFFFTTMTSYFYKNKYNEVTSFISCTWMRDELDLVDRSIEATTPICQLLVVNSAQDCYKGTGKSKDMQNAIIAPLTYEFLFSAWYNIVTYKDLDDFRRGSVTVEVLNTLIKLGLQGAEYYQGDRIAWKTVFNPNDCQVIRNETKHLCSFN